MLSSVKTTLLKSTNDNNSLIFTESIASFFLVKPNPRELTIGETVQSKAPSVSWYTFLAAEKTLLNKLSVLYVLSLFIRDIVE